MRGSDIFDALSGVRGDFISGSAPEKALSDERAFEKKRGEKRKSASPLPFRNGRIAAAASLAAVAIIAVAAVPFLRDVYTNVGNPGSGVSDGSAFSEKEDGLIRYGADGKKLNYTHGFFWTENETGVTVCGYAGRETELIIANYIGTLPVTRVTGEGKSFGKVEKLTLPESVKTIVPGAFYANASLREITLPSGVVSIGDYAFYGCTALESVTVPRSVRSIGVKAFASCPALTIYYEYSLAGWKGICSGTVKDEDTKLVTNYKAE